MAQFFLVLFYCRQYVLFLWPDIRNFETERNTEID